MKHDEKKLTLRIVGRSHGTIWFWTEIEINLLTSLGVRLWFSLFFTLAMISKLSSSGVRELFTLISKRLSEVLVNTHTISNQSFIRKSFKIETFVSDKLFRFIWFDKLRTYLVHYNVIEQFRLLSFSSLLWFQSEIFFCLHNPNFLSLYIPSICVSRRTINWDAYDFWKVSCFQH